jgi:hypothetical protein
MVALPLNVAWMDGHKVEYVTTDISDKVMAQAMGVNYVPRLADAIPSQGNRSLVERVYKFSDGSQDTVFQSAPLPAGPNNMDRNYSPLWRLVHVRRVKATLTQVLVSEEEILRAVDANEVALEITNIVINCPITRSVDGVPLTGVK